MKAVKRFAVTLLAALIAGCGGGGGSSSPAPQPSDTTPPTVSSTVPAGSATGVGVNSAITTTFSEEMDDATITDATFTLDNGATGTVTYTGTTATFTPSSNLAYSTTYTATIGTGAKDLAGNALAANYTWSFTTGAAPDTTAPTVTSTSPANSATSVAINSAITATFSEAMTAPTITTTAFTLNNGATGTVNYTGTTATFTPSSNLAYSTTYTATITTVAKDLAGNALAANYTWSFTTGAAPDTTAPTVTSTSPANSATGVAINSAITATFSEAMTASTITTATFTLDNGATGTVNYTGTTATFTPSSNLAYATTYTATISTGAKDLAGNALAANYTWSFTTGANPDITAPTVLSTVPANGATGVSLWAPITATFSEAMNATTITTVTFTLEDVNNPTNGSVTYSGTTATFTPSLNLAAFTTYTAKITTGAKDLAGNAIAATYSWSFTTGGASGGFDTGFGTSGKVTTAIGTSGDVANTMLIQPDGKIVAAGYSYSATSYDFAIVRYNADGSLDATFNTTGIVTTDFFSAADQANAVAIQSDGKIVAAGYSTNGTNYSDFAVVRYNTDGTLDTTFGTGGKVTTVIAGYDQANAVAIQSDGRIVVAGKTNYGSSYSSSDFVIARYNTNGTLDTSFGTTGTGIIRTSLGANLSDGANAISIQTDGKIIAAGYSKGAYYEFALVRYNTSGTLDTTFGTGGMVTTDVGTFNDYVNAVVIQSDGKIIAVGYTSVSQNDFALARYNTDGSLDTTFNTTGKVTTDASGGSDYAKAVAIQSDGKIVAAGYQDGTGYSTFYLVRYNTDGSLDTTFGTGGKVTTDTGGGKAYAVAIQSDSKIVAAGPSSSYQGNEDILLVRYWP